MRGGSFHNLVVDQAKAALDGVFEQVESEYLIRRNGVATFVDLYGDGESGHLAVEVETTERHAIDNARKAAAVDVPLWIVVPTQALQRRLARQVGLLDLRPGGEPICVLLLGQLAQRLTSYLSPRIQKAINNKQIKSNPEIGLGPGRP